MIEEAIGRGRALVIAIGLLAVLLLGQALGDAAVASGGGADTGQALGRAGFAYLTGVRTAAAAMLWNRLEPQLHEYYMGVPLENQTHMLPTIAMVVALDPEFEQSYYVGSWVVARQGRVEEGLELARQGAENIPGSALMRASYAQMIALFEKDYTKAAEQADIAYGLQWESLQDQHAWYGILRSIYKNAGRVDAYEMLGDDLERIDAELGDAIGAGEHDHDGDGIPDH